MKRILSLTLLILFLFTPVMNAGEFGDATIQGNPNARAYILTDREGQGHFYLNDVRNYDYTGVAYNRESERLEYVTNGVSDLSFTGMASSINDGKRYAVVHGIVDMDFTGVAKDPAIGELCYVKNGSLGYRGNGIARSISDNNNYYIKDGKIDYSFTGMAYNPLTKTWDYFNKGKADYTFTGIITGSNEETYYVSNGKASPGYYGSGIMGTLKKEEWERFGKRKGVVETPAITEGSKESFFVMSKPSIYDIYKGGRNISGLKTGFNSYYAKENSMVLEYGVVMTKYGNYVFINPSTKKVAKKEGFLDYQGKKYYSTADGILIRNSLFEVDGKVYGATEDASLAKDGWVKIGKLYYNFNNYEVEDTCLKAKAVLDKVGYSMESAYFWSGTQMPYFAFDAKPAWGTKWFADYGFEKHRGNCYVMAATFYYFAKMMGYDAHQVVGKVVREHSWIEIDIDGETFVYDPECYNEDKKVCFHAKYGDPNIWNYHDYSRMD